MRRALLIRALGPGVGVLIALGALGGPAAAREESTSPPTFIAIPAIGVEAPIVRLGLEDDGAMAAPTDPDAVGWYEPGPGIGGPGNALLAGHVDWGGRLRVFGRLGELAPGDSVELVDASGQSLLYRVAWRRLVDAESDPTTELFAQGPSEEITLVTCGGAFDPAARQYLSRLVVRAVRDAPAPAAPAPGPIPS